MGTDERSANQIDGTVHGPAIQADSIHGGIHFHLPGGPAERRDSADPELPAAVRLLLRAQVQAALDFPYRLHGARRPSLATVYVRQDLGTGGADSTDPEQARPVPIVDERGQLVDPPRRPVVRLTVRPPSRTVWEALDGDEHVLVTGGPGQGKSTLSLRLAADVAEQLLSSERGLLTEPVVPLRLTARVLGAQLGLPFPEAVAQSARTEYGALLGASLDPHMFAQRIAGCRWLLLVDGLDEVADSTERDRLVTVLATWASDTGSPYRIMLTTRPIEGTALAPMQRIGAARYELQPFDEEALRGFAANWFDDTDVAARFVRQIRAANLDELVRVPLLATIAAIIFEQHTDRPLPDNQYELYESYLRYLRTAHSLPPSPFDRVRDPLLEHLGRVRLENDTSLVAAASDWMTDNLAEGWQEELVTYLTAVGPLVRRNDDLGFLHHSFAEHLAATAKARLLPVPFEPEDQDVARLLHAARPDERGQHARAVLLHYTRLHPKEADHLLGWLHNAGADQHLLAARLLAGHVPASVNAVDAFLITVRAWAMTTQHHGQEMLEQASRAAHHPGIARWLAELLWDDAAPWASRIEAATALAARLRRELSADGIVLLRQVVDDEAIPVEHRLAAAEALADCGVDQREVSERGLRSVLADPDATASDYRTAAVVLAGFGGAARTDAVAALTKLLDDPWTPDDELVEIATGLVEIGVEFHERCAEIFRRILNSRTTSAAGLRDAAIVLASLQRSDEAVAALTALITDMRVDCLDRIEAAKALAELGPQHRHAAGEHLLTMSAEFGMTSYERRWMADCLAQIGLHRPAVELLRAVLTDHTAHPNYCYWACRTLADLGPDYEEEAAQGLHHVVDRPRTGGYDRVNAWARLAAFGEPHRSPAIAALRTILADQGADHEFRGNAASELAGLGPEFHGEAAEHLLAIASSHGDPFCCGGAWRRLRGMGAFRAVASTEFVALIKANGASAWKTNYYFWRPNRDDTDDYTSLAGAVTAVLRDPTCGGRDRIDAAQALVGLGRRFHRTALDGVIDWLRSQAIPADQISSTARPFKRLGSGPRAELAEALHTLLRDQHVDAATVCGVAEALEALDYRADTEVIASLRHIVSDYADTNVGDDAAVALSRAVPEELCDMAAVVLRRTENRTVYPWERRVHALAALGADIAPSLHRLLSHADATYSKREKAAAILARLSPELRGEALAELRTQADDAYLIFWGRAEAARRLAEIDPTMLDETITYFQVVLRDESQPILYRIQAAHQLAQFDRPVAQEAFATLRWLATGPEFTAEEHEQSVRFLHYLSYVPTGTIVPLSLAVTHDPAATAEVRGRICDLLRGRTRIEVQRSIIADRTASPDHRVNDLTVWEHPVLAKDAEAALHDVRTAPESTPTERVTAIVALSKLSPRHIPEAAGLLEQLINAGRATTEAAVELAKLGQPWSRQVLGAAEQIVADETLPRQQRTNAARTICRLSTNPPERVVHYLRQRLQDKRTADNVRIHILYDLRQIDGLDRLRQIRDEERTPPAIRLAAANKLRDHDIADRVAGARVLHAITADTVNRPALRWQAARDLTMFGNNGRRLGIPALQTIFADDALPVTIRAVAARALGEARPDMRREVVRSLHPLHNTEQQAAQVKVFEAIGQFDPAEGARALQTLARDHSLNPGTRLRAAETMVKLHRDYKESAAVAAREIAHEETLPPHIRVKAARALARYSDLCRTEAQTLLIQLNASPWPTR
jgi:uncharacterized protein (UPF0147 family)